jgi:hypothetical protein
MYHEYAIHFRSGRTFYCSGFESAESLVQTLRDGAGGKRGPMGEWADYGESANLRDDHDDLHLVELSISGCGPAWPVESIEDRRTALAARGVV